MKYVYTRLGDPAAAGLPVRADAGWLVGASARGLPHRRAWIDYPGRNSSDIWRDMAFTPPPPTRRQAWPAAEQDAYILQQDPNGLWCIDAWATSAGIVRAARTTDAAANGGHDMNNTSFIIELELFTQR